MSINPEDWFEKRKPELDRFFSKISDVLNTFADVHNLKIEKYSHNFPMWTFVFRHPKEGIAQIEVRKEEDDDNVRICPGWWIDKAKPFTRFWYSSEGEISSLEPGVLEMFLKNALKNIAQWDNSILKPITNPYIEKGVVTKQKITKEIEKYPVPKID